MVLPTMGAKKTGGINMSRVMRRTPYGKVRFSFRKLADGTYAHVAVTPCEKCASWKVNVCKNCPTATSNDIEKHIEYKLEFVHNMEEDRWVQEKYCEVQGKYTAYPVRCPECYHDEFHYEGLNNNPTCTKCGYERKQED